jgi:hypothetical protein
MKTVVENKEVKNLTAYDRCDQCDSQAYVSVTGISGDLLFCGHHFTKIEKNAVAYEKLKAFAYVINDERNKLSDKRAGL